MITDFDRTPWKLIQPDLALFRYIGSPNSPDKIGQPVLMLHGPMTSHRTWDTLATALREQGMLDLYAVDIADVQMGSSLRHASQFLEHVVEWLTTQYGQTMHLILIGHSTGGVLARRFLLKSPLAASITYLFSLGSPHGQTHFSYQVYVPEMVEGDLGRESTGTMSIVKTPKLAQDTFIVNIIGDAVGNLFDGTVHGVLLPEGVNAVYRLGHAELKQSREVVEEILACLRGERYRLQFFLQNMLMRTADQENGLVGPFYFEFNEIRSPFSCIFQAMADQQYSFEEDSTPLATLAFPLDQTLATTVIRLRDMSRTRPTRRRLLAKLLGALHDGQMALHEMQDNEGSLITLRVVTQRLPKLLG
jgi:pimeloyl-ACP methyl ester carboxylesterase